MSYSIALFEIMALNHIHGHSKCYILAANEAFTLSSINKFSEVDFRPIDIGVSDRLGA
jgi:hypothetical protein